MQTLESWGEFGTLIGKLDMPKEDNYLLIKGAFNLRIPISEKVPNEVYSNAQQIEDIVRNSFPNSVSVEGIQTPNTENPKESMSRYEGLVYAQTNNAMIGYLYMNANHVKVSPPIGRRKLKDAYVQFTAQLPLGDHKQASLQVLKDIWPKVDTIEYAANPSETEMPSVRKFANQMIFLMEGGKPVVIGHEALQEVGAALPKKNTSLLGGYVA